MNTNINKYIESINNNRNILDKLLTITKLQNQSLYFYISQNYKSRLKFHNLYDYIKELHNNINYEHTGIIYDINHIYKLYIGFTKKTITIYNNNTKLICDICKKYNIKNYEYENIQVNKDIYISNIYINYIISIFIDIMKIEINCSL